MPMHRYLNQGPSSTHLVKKAGKAPVFHLYTYLQLILIKCLFLYYIIIGDIDRRRRHQRSPTSAVNDQHSSAISIWTSPKNIIESWQRTSNLINICNPDICSILYRIQSMQGRSWPGGPGVRTPQPASRSLFQIAQIR